jgi:hypothetical protein
MFSSLRKLILVGLGIPFVILGTRFLLDTGQTVLTHWSASSWTTGNAALLAVDHFSSSDQALGNQTVVRYQYESGGQSFDGQYSCIGDECPQADLHMVLRTVQAENRTVAVLIDPDRPQRSLLYRHLYMPLFLLKAGAGLFCFLTGSVAVVFGVYLLRGPVPARRKE